MADTELLAGSAPSYSQFFGSVFTDTGISLNPDPGSSMLLNIIGSNPDTDPD
jgi:hypothetical protein